MSRCKRSSSRMHLVPKGCMIFGRPGRGRKQAKDLSRTAGLRGCGIAAGAAAVPLTHLAWSSWSRSLASRRSGSAPVRRTSCSRPRAVGRRASAAGSKPGSSVLANAVTPPARCRWSPAKGSGGHKAKPVSARCSGESRASGDGAAPATTASSSSRPPRAELQCKCRLEPLSAHRLCLQLVLPLGCMGASRRLALRPGRMPGGTLLNRMLRPAGRVLLEGKCLQRA
jgi:hypothetical protein